MTRTSSVREFSAACISLHLDLPNSFDTRPDESVKTRVDVRHAKRMKIEAKHNTKYDLNIMYRQLAV